METENKTQTKYKKLSRGYLKVTFKIDGDGWEYPIKREIIKELPKEIKLSYLNTL